MYRLFQELTVLAYTCRCIAGTDPQHVGAEALDSPIESLLETFTNRQQRNHRRHADNNTQHRQEGAQLIDHQGVQGNIDAFPDLHK